MSTKASFADETRRARAQTPRRATVRLPSAAEENLEERLALLTCAFAKEDRARLLGGLAAAKVNAAISSAEEVAGLSSSARAARIATAFQERPEARERARRLVGEAAPALSQAILAELPPYLRPDGAVPRPSLEVTPEQVAFAIRLAQEASR